MLHVAPLRENLRTVIPLGLAVAALLAAGTLAVLDVDEEKTSDDTFAAGEREPRVEGEPVTAPLPVLPEPGPQATPQTSAPETVTSSPSPFRSRPATGRTTSATNVCGTGSPSVEVETGTISLEGSTRRFRPRATVANNATKAIELDRLTIRITYGDGQTDLLDAGAVGTVVQPGASVDFQFNEVTHDARVEDIEVAEFRFHTAGHPECASV